MCRRLGGRRVSYSRWVDAGDGFSVLGFDPFIVDKETSWLSIFDSVWSSQLDFKIDAGHFEC
jgi:hypothetical protein